MATSRSAKKQVGESLERNPNEIYAGIIDEINDDNGAIKVSDNVIVSVVRKYVLEVAGVVRFASNSPVSTLKEMLGRRSSDSNVVVSKDTSDNLIISVTLVLEFGVYIPDIASSVQSIVSAKVEEITGKRVSRVNVLISDMEEVDYPEEEK